MEYKEFTHFTKEINDRTVVGLASIIGNIDGGSDIIHKGAFKKTIKENNGRIKHLWMHDPWQPPTAVIKGLQEVGIDDLPDELKARYPDATGGLEVAREYLNTPRGDEMLEGIRKEAINQMSIGYDTVKHDFDEAERDGIKVPVRNLRELKLWDTSDVTWGLNMATVASKSNVENHLMELVELTDAIKAGRVLSARNLQRLKDALTTLSEILEAAEPLEDEETDEDEKAIQPIIEVVETLPQKALTVEGIARRLEIARRQAYLYGV